MIASVHDEILCDSPAELAEETKNCMTTVMTQPWREIGGMVFPISIGIKDSWGDFE
jgi:DNA polymerase I-like protein with 3'-5' exonuclease and polymerase domains